MTAQTKHLEPRTAELLLGLNLQGPERTRTKQRSGLANESAHVGAFGQPIPRLDAWSALKLVGVVIICSPFLLLAGIIAVFVDWSWVATRERFIRKYPPVLAATNNAAGRHYPVH